MFVRTSIAPARKATSLAALVAAAVLLGATTSASAASSNSTDASETAFSPIALPVQFQDEGDEEDEEGGPLEETIEIIQQIIEWLT